MYEIEIISVMFCKIALYEKDNKKQDVYVDILKINAHICYELN